MTVRKLSISVSPEIERIIKQAAAREGKTVSAWLASAAEHEAAETRALEEGRAAARELIAEYESEHGPIPEDARRRADEILAELGLFDMRAAG
jgi:hypothetical protein